MQACPTMELCSRRSVLVGLPRQRLAAASGRVSTAARCPVVAMAKPTKATDFRGLSAEQLEAEVATAKRQLFDLRLKQKTRQEIKTSDFGFYQRKVAQLLTIKRERELAEGVDKRTSRKMEKAKRLAEGFGQF